MNHVCRWLSCTLVGCLLLATYSIAQEPAGESPFSDAPAVNKRAAEKSVVAAGMAPVGKAHDDSEEFCHCIGSHGTEAAKNIERVLRKPLHNSGLDFTEQPLNDVMNTLQEDYSIPIQIDKPALDAAGLRVEELVSVNIHNVSLQSALRLLLKSQQLTWVIQDEVLLITTPDEAEKKLQICVYDVSSIAGASATQLDEVIDMIQSCVETETWAVNGGGQADIRAIKPGILVITQISAIHDEIRDLLIAIRQARGGAVPQKTAAATRGDADSSEVITRSYVLQVSGNDTDAIRSQVRELITASLPDETWSGRLANGESVTLTVFPDRVVVRQTQGVQEKVEKILSDRGVATSTAKVARVNGGGGGMGGFGGGQASNRGGGMGGGGFFNPARNAPSK